VPDVSERPGDADNATKRTLFDAFSTLESMHALDLADGSNVSYIYSPNEGQLLNEAGATASCAGGTNGASIPERSKWAARR
jgi:hypothetical protein